MKISQSFPSRLSLYVITAVTVLSVLALASIYLNSRQSLKKESVFLAESNLSRLTADVENMIDKVETATDNMVWVVEEHLDDPEYMYDITRNLINSNSEIVGAAVAFIPDYFESKGLYYAPYTFVDSFDGKMKSIQMGNEEYHYFDMEWFKSPIDLSKSRWSEPYFDEGGGDQMMATYSVPVKDSTGRNVAILTADVSLTSLTQLFSSMKLYDDSYTFIISRTGVYIVHPDSTKLLTTTIYDVAERSGVSKLAELGDRMLNGNSGRMDLRLASGKLYSIVYGPIKNGWSTSYLSPYREVYSELKGQMAVAVIVMILDMLLLFFVVRRIITRTSNPITEFAFTALNIAKGNFNTKLPEVKTQDEIRRLRDSLDFMVRSIKEYMTELKTATASKERLESELSIASGIQASMLSKNFPKNEFVDLHAILHPAKEVGGDLYDFFIKDNKLYFAVGDVSGKGVPAALFMAITRSAFRFIAGMDLQQKEVLDHINNAVCNGNDTNMFVTMFIGKIDLETGKMRYCNAGHNPIILIHPDGQAEYLHAKPNLAIGLFENFPYEDETISLEKGSRLLIYTDGVTEAERMDKQLFGEDRLLSFVSSLPVTENSEKYLEAILADVRSFTAGNEQNDDITMMSLKF